MLFTVCCYWMQLSRLCVTMAARSQCHTASSNKPLLQYCHKQNWYLLSPWVLDIRKLIFRQVHLFWKITISLLRSHITVNFPVFPTHNYWLAGGPKDLKKIGDCRDSTMSVIALKVHQTLNQTAIMSHLSTVRYIKQISHITTSFLHDNGTIRSHILRFQYCPQQPVPPLR